jgi:ABC-type phosphate transport system substrate-binding protein
MAATTSALLLALAALVVALTLSAAPPASAQTGVSVATLKVAGESAFTGLFTQLASSYLFSKDDVSLTFLAQNDSDDGLRLYSAGNADGALVSVPAATGDDWPGMVYVPIACMPIVPIYRLPTVSSLPLVLDCATLGGIWAGSVTNWRDPRVIALNSANEAMLPDADITLLVDSWAGESAMGISGAFARSLSGCSDEFAQAWANSGRDWTQMPPVVGGWATAVANRVSGLIQRPSDEGVLTYGTYSEATTATATAAGVKIASMMPNSPAAVTPIGAAGVLTAATSAMGTALTAFSDGSLTNVGPSSGVVTSNATTDWPLVSLLMLTIAANSSGRGLPVGTSAVGDCSYPRELLLMMAWIQVNERVDTMLTQQGFAPLPKTFRSHATDLVGTVSCGGTRILDQAALIAMGEPLVYVYQRMADSYTSGTFKVKFYSGNTDLVYNTMPTVRSQPPQT